MKGQENTGDPVKSVQWAMTHYGGKKAYTFVTSLDSTRVILVIQEKPDHLSLLDHKSEWPLRSLLCNTQTVYNKDL